MNQKRILFLLLLICSLCFSGCGSKSEDVPHTETEPVTALPESESIAQTDSFDGTQTEAESASESEAQGSESESESTSETENESASDTESESASETESEAFTQSEYTDESESESEPHQHETGWVGDEHGHYTGYVCGCENEGDPSYFDHKDADKNGFCDVCTFVTYASEYSASKTEHWQAVSCGCWIAPQKEAHRDEGGDGKCDICLYVLCAHTYRDTYTHDETHHWKENTCACVVAPDRSLHVRGGIMIENRVSATHEKEGSYDEVVYCTDCKRELSRTTKTVPVKPESEKSYSVIERYMPASLSSSLKTMFETGEAPFSTFSYGSCPYVIRDVYTLSDCRLLSISIPVSQTKTVGGDGNFTFTITVGGNGWSDMKQTPARVVTVKINAEAYGLTSNDSAVHKWITVDLTSYDIVLSKSQTVGFGKSGDTLIPAYLGSGDNTNQALALIKKDFSQMVGFLKSMGKGTTIESSQGTLVFDFELERTYESKDEYDSAMSAKAEAEESYAKLLAAVKEAYAGKKLSILGDSISTFKGFSNNTNYNSTIGSNAVYYPTKNTALYDHTQTYWGRLLADLDMTLCVNNAWSNSKVLDSTHMPSRAGELDNREDVPPDVIIFYMGINDLHQGSAYGDLYAMLTDDTDERSKNEKIAAWLETIPAQRATFDQAYARALMTMTDKYKGAEIWCMTLNTNNDSRMTQEKLTAFNCIITSLADYFGANVISQQQGYITQENCHNYTNDNNCLHPNAEGHAMIEKLIVESFYKNLAK